MLAYLPLPQERISIVWFKFHKSEALMALSDGDFAERVATQGEHSLGKPPHRPPLLPLNWSCAAPKNVRATHRLARRCRLPPSNHHGVKVNLSAMPGGFGKHLTRRSRLYACSSVLRQYEAERLHAVRSMGCDGLFQLFKNRSRAFGLLRNTGT